jgi:hypothetical protein
MVNDTEINGLEFNGQYVDSSNQNPRTWSTDWTKTIISQYAPSPTINAIIDYFNQCTDITADIDNLYQYIWNVETAVGFGLDIWGRIVGVSRSISTDSGDITLSDSQFRTLILLKAASNISNSSIPAINGFLRDLFGDSGRVYAIVPTYRTDSSPYPTGVMRLRYVFEYIPDDIQQAILAQSGIVPKPAGVRLDALIMDPATTFGFNGSGLQPFNHGTFAGLTQLA